jgi:hypothetical protein
VDIATKIVTVRVLMDSDVVFVCLIKALRFMIMHLHLIRWLLAPTRLLTDILAMNIVVDVLAYLTVLNMVWLLPKLAKFGRPRADLLKSAIVIGHNTHGSAVTGVMMGNLAAFMAVRVVVMDFGDFAKGQQHLPIPLIHPPRTVEEHVAYMMMDMMDMIMIHTHGIIGIIVL